MLKFVNFRTLEISRSFLEYSVHQENFSITQEMYGKFQNHFGTFLGMLENSKILEISRTFCCNAAFYKILKVKVLRYLLLEAASISHLRVAQCLICFGELSINKHGELFLLKFSFLELFLWTLFLLLLLPQSGVFSRYQSSDILVSLHNGKINSP